MITMKIEYELNRAWVYDKDNETIGETNFVVPVEWLVNLFEKYYRDEYGDFEMFLDVYEPEMEGEFIYQKAIEDDVLIEDIGVVMY